MKLRALCLVAAVAGSSAILGLGGQAASAQSDYSGAVYQITYSLNCDNANCAPEFGLGGSWGWIQLSATSGNAQETVCQHPGPGSGAFHLAVDNLVWTKVHSDTPMGPAVDPNGNYLIINPNPFGLPPMPATFGHYAFHPFGANGQVTIAP